MSHPQTDIIIPAHGKKELIEPLLEGVFKHTENFRLIFVDDFSDVETTAFLVGVLQRQSTALYIRTGQQKWFTRASNLGLRLVRTSRAVLLNTDCVVDVGWLQELYDVWDEAASHGLRVGLVGSTLSGEEQRRWAEYREPGYVTGHCLLLSMEALSAISDRRGQAGWYFDEVSQECIHIASDRIACWEMNRMGYATVASFKSAVGHYGGQSWSYNLGRVSQLRIGDPLKGEVLG